MELVDKLSNRQYIDGEWVESSNKNTRDIINPYNQETIFTVACLLYTSPSPRDLSTSRMPSSA